MPDFNEHKIYSKNFLESISDLYEFQVNSDSDSVQEIVSIVSTQPERNCPCYKPFVNLSMGSKLSMECKSALKTF